MGPIWTIWTKQTGRQTRVNSGESRVWRCFLGFLTERERFVAVDRVQNEPLSGPIPVNRENAGNGYGVPELAWPLGQRNTCACPARTTVFPENLLEVILHKPPPTVWKIVPAYSEHGRSGLNIVGRKGLSRLRVHDHDAHLNQMLVHSEWDHYCLGQ